jgi:hypothetical protein
MLLLVTTMSTRRRGRNANAPITQQDQDADIENSFRYDANLTTQDRIEIDRSLDESTRSILAAFGSSILWLFGNNTAEIQLLIDLHRKTQSDFVRAKTNTTIQWIADYSPIESAHRLNPPRLRGVHESGIGPAYHVTDPVEIITFEKPFAFVFPCR